MPYIGSQPTTTAFVTDTFNGNGSTTVFTMSLAPATTSSILVAVTGVLQDPSTYSVSGTTLTFSAAPPSGTGNISVRYLGIPASGVTTTAYRTVTEFTATAGQTSFSVPSYTVGYIDVYRNGSKLGSADYTATTGTTVVLVSGCSAGDLVQTVSFYVSSVLNAIPATAGAVNSTYIAGGAVGSAQIAAGGVAQSNLAAGVAGNGPAFSATSNNGTALTNNAYTKVVFNVKDFDTNTNYDANTNYRFTPTVAGYYHFDWVIVFGPATGTGEVFSTLHKNGANWVWGTNVNGITTHYFTSSGSSLVYANGTTDYFEIYAYNGSGGSLQFNPNSGSFPCRFSGTLVRAA